MAMSAVLLAFSYTALAGFALPTWRTFLMIAVVAMAKLSRRPIRISQSMALALIAILLFDPLSVLAPGFWLSLPVSRGWCGVCLRIGANDVKPRTTSEIIFSIAMDCLARPVAAIHWFSGKHLCWPLTNLVGIPGITWFSAPGINRTINVSGTFGCRYFSGS